MQCNHPSGMIGFLLFAAVSCAACSSMPFFKDPPRELPCGVPEEDGGVVRICPEGFPWCACATLRCGKAGAEKCETGFLHADGSCLTIEEAGSLKPSLPGSHPSCMAICSDDLGCDDGSDCNGQELCLDNLCVDGTPMQDGAPCEHGGSMDGACRAGRCAVPTCGDGVVDPPFEECDDGNVEDEDDDCRNDCLWRCRGDVECGDDDPCDGWEECDAPSHLCLAGVPQQNGTVCSKLGIVGECKAWRCVPEGCGNLAVGDGEECDDGNESDNDSCLIDCRANRCGDGYVNAGAEECDRGDAIDGDGCDADCKWSCLSEEACRMSGVCRACDRSDHKCDGDILPDGESCMVRGEPGAVGVCSGGNCIPAP